MRPLFFLLEGLVNLFRYLSYGLAAVLAFIGVKIIVETETTIQSMTIGGWTIAGFAIPEINIPSMTIGVHDQFHDLIHNLGVPDDQISITITLGALAIVIAILVISVIASVVLPQSEEDHHSHDEAAA